MKLRSLLPSGAWQCFALTCLIGAFVAGNTSGKPTNTTRIYQDSIPSHTPDSLQMLQKYTGTYIIPGDPELLIVLEQGKLYGIPKSGNKHIMVRTGQHQFFVPEKDIHMQFEMDSYDQVALLQLSKDDRSVTATKKK